MKQAQTNHTGIIKRIFSSLNQTPETWDLVNLPVSDTPIVGRSRIRGEAVFLTGPLILFHPVDQTVIDPCGSLCYEFALRKKGIDGVYYRSIPTTPEQTDFIRCSRLFSLLIEQTKKHQ